MPQLPPTQGPFVTKNMWDIKCNSWARVWDHYLILAMKLVYDEKSPLTDLDYEFLVRANIYLDAVQNPDFVLYKKVKFNKIRLNIIEYYLRSQKNGQYPSKDLQRILRPQLLISQKIIPHFRQYFGNYRHLTNSRPLLIRIDSNKRYIQRSKKTMGVGYRDKGSMKHPELDGSPDWKEINHHTDNFREFPDRFYNLDYIRLLYRGGELPNEFGLEFTELIDKLSDGFD